VKEAPEATRTISWGWAVQPGEDLFVVHAGELCPGYPLNPRNRHQTDFWQLDYSFTPHFLKIGTDKWRLRETNVGYLIPRYKPWWEKLAPEYPHWPHKCVITFAVSPRLDFDRKYWGEAPLGYVRFRDPDCVLANAMTRVAATARTAADSGYGVVHGLVWDLLRSLMTLSPEEPGVYVVRAADLRRPVDPVVSRATAYMQMRLADRIGVAEVACHLHMSPSTLTHRFKAAAQEGPMRTLQGLRIQRAKALLVQGWKLDAIAEATGFYGGFHLSRVFKKVTGISPASFVAAYAARRAQECRAP